MFSSLPDATVRKLNTPNHPLNASNVQTMDGIGVGQRGVAGCGLVDGESFKELPIAVAVAFTLQKMQMPMTPCHSGETQKAQRNPAKASVSVYSSVTMLPFSET